MSSGPFMLVANDGKADALLSATHILSQRIQDIIAVRESEGEVNPIPTLYDLERTHILFVNAHYKPFAAVAFEYIKARASAGAVVMAGDLAFQIPQHGDFFNDAVIHSTISEVTCTAAATPTQGTGNFVADAAPLYYSLVDSFGAAIATPGTTTNANLVAYCDYPANRFIETLKFNVNGSPLDEYSIYANMMHEKFMVAPNKRIAYDRLTGQEVPVPGYGATQACGVMDRDAANTPAAAMVAKFGASIAATAALVPGGVPAISLTGATRASYYDYSRQKKMFVNGPQTPKLTQPALDLWHQLNLWFVKSPEMAVPSVSIPFGQREVSVKVAAQADMIFQVPNLYVKKTAWVGTGATVTYFPYSSSTSTYTPIVNTITSATLSNVELYINNLFVAPDIHDIYINRVGFTLIRVHRVHTQILSEESTSEIQLTQLKWPIEYMCFGLRPTYNSKATNPNKRRDWCRLTRIVDADSDCRTRTAVSAATTGATPDDLSIESQVVRDSYAVEVPTVVQLSATLHGVKLIDASDAKLFNSYMVYHYGGPNIMAPEDEGALFVNFCLYPGSYQPSGHINVSRAREFFIKWTTNYSSTSTNVEAICDASAINFLLISDGAAVLRYTT